MSPSVTATNGAAMMMVSACVRLPLSHTARSKRETQRDENRCERREGEDADAQRVHNHVGERLAVFIAREVGQIREDADGERIRENLNQAGADEA